MEENEMPRSGIKVEETFHYRVELGQTSQVMWQAASGVVRVHVPYEGSRLKDFSQHRLRTDWVKCN